MPITPQLPRHLDDVTPDWLHSVMGPALKGTRIAGVDVRHVILGTAAKAVIDLRFAGTVPDGVPRSICVKGGLGEGQADAVAAMGAYEAEGRFYRDIRPHIAMAAPQMYYIGVDPLTRDCVMVMEDLTAQGAVFSRVTNTALTPDQTATLLEYLAGLHANWWRRPDDALVRGLETGITPTNLLGRYFMVCDEANVAGWLARPRGAGIPDHLHDPARLIKGFWINAALSCGPPVCLLHGDSHVGNTYVLSDGAPGLCDWQTMRMGHWSHDVAYLVGSSLAPAERGGAEPDLLRRYLECLRAKGVVAPSFDEAWLAYRQAMMYGLFGWLTNLLEFQPEEISAATTARFAVAMVELETLKALDV